MLVEQLTQECTVGGTESLRVLGEWDNGAEDGARMCALRGGTLSIGDRYRRDAHRGSPTL